MLIAVRLVGGAMQANQAVANAYVADITRSSAPNASACWARCSASASYRSVMGGLLGAINLQLPFFVSGTLALINLAYAISCCRNHCRSSAAGLQLADDKSVDVAARIDRIARVGRLVAVVALSGLAQFVLYTSWVLYTTFKLAGGHRKMAGPRRGRIMSVIVQGFLLGRLLRHFSPRRLASPD